MDEISFDDLTLREVPVRLGGTRYLLREASGGAACGYRNAVLRATKLGPDGKPASFEGLADAEPVLVAGCLFEETPAGPRPVPLATVRGWPAKVVKRLFLEAQKLSELDERQTAEELQARIAEDQARLAALERNGEAPPKAGPGTTPAGSPSPSGWGSPSASA